MKGWVRMRVHELAKSLNISSKDICQFLSTDDKVYKTMSGLNDEEIERVKSRFGAAEQKTSEEHRDIPADDNKGKKDNLSNL